MFRIILLSVLFFSVSSLTAEPKIKIGAVLPLSGDAQNFGQEAQMALPHALTDSPKQKFSYELLFEDDQLSSAKAALAAKKLLEIDQVKIIFSNWSYGGQAVAATLKNREAINLAFAWDRSILDVSSNNYLISSPPEKLAKIVIQKIKDEGHQTIVLIGFLEAGVEFAFNALELEAKKNGIEVLKRIETNPAEPADYKSHLVQIKKMNPDYIVSCLIYPQMLELLKQMKRFQMDIPLAYIGQAPYGPALKPFLPKIWWSVDYQVGTDQYKDVQERTGLQDFSGYPSYYETLKTIIEIYESAPTPNIPELTWVQSKLNHYQRDRSLLGKIRYQDQLLYSENARVINQLAKY